MKPQEIEGQLEATGFEWKRIMKNLWAVRGEAGKFPQISISVEPGRDGKESLLKFLIFVCDVPQDAGTEFFHEFLKLNFRMEHGAFGMETRSEMIFVDTLEMARLDPEEFGATLRAIREAPMRFKERYDIDVFTMGEPQF